MTALDTLKSLIRKFEGLKLEAYRCPAGIWTCGYGTTGHGVKEGVTWTLEQAELFMEQDAQEAIDSTLKFCPSLTGSKLAAIADFTYNLGAGALQTSTLRKKINNNDIDGACAELKKWVHGGGKVLPGLVKRRNAEIELLIGE